MAAWEHVKHYLKTGSPPPDKSFHPSHLNGAAEDSADQVAEELDEVLEKLELLQEHGYLEEKHRRRAWEALSVGLRDEEFDEKTEALIEALIEATAENTAGARSHRDRQAGKRLGSITRILAPAEDERRLHLILGFVTYLYLFDKPAEEAPQLLEELGHQLENRRKHLQEKLNESWRDLQENLSSALEVSNKMQEMMREIYDELGAKMSEVVDHALGGLEGIDYGTRRTVRKKAFSRLARDMIDHFGKDWLKESSMDEMKKWLETSDSEVLKEFVEEYGLEARRQERKELKEKTETLEGIKRRGVQVEQVFKVLHEKAPAPVSSKEIAERLYEGESKGSVRNRTGSVTRILDTLLEEENVGDLIIGDKKGWKLSEVGEAATWFLYEGYEPVLYAFGMDRSGVPERVAQI